MSKIIKPMGPVVRRVTIEMDAAGTTQVGAYTIALGKSIPMQPLEFVSILAQLVSSSLQRLGNALDKQEKVNAETKSNHD
jgi:hypothetical protein